MRRNFGASGQVTVAAGLGANVLIGGSNNTIALQPVSVSTSVGLNLALGVAELHLRPGLDLTQKSAGSRVPDRVESYFRFPQKRWMRRQASSTSSVLVA